MKQSRAWELYASPGTSIAQRGRLIDLFTKSQIRADCAPSIVALIGSKGKLPRHVEDIPPSCFAQLTFEAIGKRPPLVFAKIDLERIRSGRLAAEKPRRYQPSAVYQGHGHDSLLSFIDHVIGRSILRFADVVCLFADEFISTDAALIYLRQWMTLAKSECCFWQPRLIIIAKEQDRCIDLSSFYVQFLTPGEKPGVVPALLEQSILRDVELVRAQRGTNKSLFSITHLNAFLEGALHHVSQSHSSFDLVRHTRYSFASPPDFGRMIATYLTICQRHNVDVECMERYIASALVLDSCPPGMHRFPAEYVFGALYHEPCMEAFRRCSLQLQTSLDDIKAAYLEVESQQSGSGLSARAFHGQQMSNLAIDWTKLKSSQICLYCLGREPEHPMQCGHSVCDVCSQIFGHPSSVGEYHYLLSFCMLCHRQSNLIIRLKPPTAAPRLLSLDGGGIRAIFTLEALQALQTYLNLPGLVYEQFDLAVGTSSGGLIVMMMMLGKDVLDCISTFEKLATDLFSSTMKPDRMLTRLWKLFKCLVTDSIHGPKRIEACVREAYGVDTPIFNSTTKNSGRKYGVTTMTVAGSGLCLLTNYNGNFERRGYRHFGPASGENELKVHEAARATSAAPFYFPAKFIHGLGYVQDGGAGKYNNPIDPTQWESTALWGKKPDFIASIGTGYPETSPLLQSVSYQRRLGICDRFIIRLLRLFSHMLDAESSWNEHLNRTDTDDHDKHFRINMPLKQEPELDDIKSLPSLKELSRQFFRQHNLTGLAQAIFAASFFFELASVPVTRKNRHICTGYIRSRNTDTNALILRILKEYPQAAFTVNGHLHIGLLGSRGWCKPCNVLQHPVTFDVPQLDQPFSIHLIFDRTTKRNISGFPQSSNYMVEKQSLNRTFGRENHDSAEVTTRERCSCSKKKRKLETALHYSTNKRSKRYVKDTHTD